MKYTIAKDIFNPENEIMFDLLTGTQIGLINKTAKGFQPNICKGNKSSAIFNTPELARNYISTIIYGYDKKRNKANAKQLALF
jgi:hypothetical protein